MLTSIWPGAIDRLPEIVFGLVFVRDVTKFEFEHFELERWRILANCATFSIRRKLKFLSHRMWIRECRETSVPEVHTASSRSPITRVYDNLETKAFIIFIKWIIIVGPACFLLLLYAIMNKVDLRVQGAAAPNFAPCCTPLVWDL